jgi:hypothetical protein
VKETPSRHVLRCLFDQGNNPGRPARVMMLGTVILIFKVAKRCHKGQFVKKFQPFRCFGPGGTESSNFFTTEDEFVKLE